MAQYKISQTFLDQTQLKGVVFNLLENQIQTPCILKPSDGYIEVEGNDMWFVSQGKRIPTCDLPDAYIAFGWIELME